MKSFRSTIFFAVMVGALVGYAYLDNESSKKAEEKKAEAEKILAFQSNDIQAFKVVKRGEEILAKKENGSWLLSSPVVDQADNEVIAGWLESMAQEKATPLKPEKPGPINWSEYFLADPGVTIELTKGDQSKVEFSISANAAFDGSYFVRKNDELYLGASSWAQIMDKSSRQMRNKKLLRQGGKMSRIQIEMIDGKLKHKTLLSREGDGPWAVEGQKNWVIDQSKVEKLVDEISRLRAQEYLAEQKSQAKLADFGLKPAATRVLVKFEKQEPALPDWLVEVSAETKGSLYGLTSSLDALFTLNSMEVESLRRRPEDFRDGKAPFQLAVEQVQKMAVKTPAGQFSLQKEGSEWKLDPQDDKREVDSKSLESMLTKLSQFEVKEFLGAVKGKGLQKPATELALKGSDGQALFTLALGDEFKPTSGPHQSEDMVYARVSGLKEDIGLAANTVKELALASLVKDKSSTLSEKQ